VWAEKPMNGLVQKNGPIIVDGYSLPSGYGSTMAVGDSEIDQIWETYYHEVSLLKRPIVVRAEFGGLDPILSWCKVNTEDIWKWKLINMPNEQEKGTYEFWFKSDVDADLFALRWK
jgi:hypothetical protein